MIIDVPTLLGPGRLTVSAAAEPKAIVWLGHGAGGGIGAVDLAALAAQLPRLGFTVVRYEQPWRVAGKAIAPRPATLDIAWLETRPAIAELAAGLPIVVGGRSAGARVACRTADELDAVAVVCLAFPLHPPGKPEASRLPELLLPSAPTLVVQGDRDTFGTARDIEREARDRNSIRIVPVAGADHSMKVLASSPLTASDVAALVTASVAAFVNGVLG